MSWNQWATVMSLLAKTLEGKSDKFPYVITSLRHYVIKLLSDKDRVFFIA